MRFPSMLAAPPDRIRYETREFESETVVSNDFYSSDINIKITVTSHHFSSLFLSLIVSSLTLYLYL